MAHPTRDDLIFARRHRRAQARRRGFLPIVGIRVHEIERFLADQYGDMLPNDDAGQDDLFVLLNHCAFYHNPRRRMVDRAARWAPWHDADALDDLITDICARPFRWRADTLAARLGLDDATRTRLGIRTIGAIDLSKEQRAARRKAQDLQKKEAARRAAGIAPRKKSQKRAPWRALGISRRTYYRRRAALDVAA